MNSKTAFLIVLLSLPCFGSGEESRQVFVLAVDRIVVGNGLVYNGTQLSGTVKSGCIKKGDSFEVIRDGIVLGKELASVVSVPGKLGNEAEEGESVEILIHRKKDLGYRSGDVLMSRDTSCAGEKSASESQ